MYSGLVLGWAFGLGENRWMYGQALKMAYETVGHLPMTLVSDRFPGHNTDEWIQTRERLTKLGVKCDITSEATGKARIERWIGTLQTVFEMQSEFFYGEGIRSKRTYSHRHPEYMAKLRKRAAKNGWDVTEAVGEAERVIEAYNTTKLSAYSKKFKSVEKSPTELYGESEKPNVRLVASHTKLLVMAETKAMQIRGDMIVTTINGLECEYAVESKETWLNYPSVLVAFDAQDLGTVSLFDAKTEVYLGEASLITKVQRYGTETNPEALGERKAVIAGNELYKKTLFIEMTAAGQGVNEETLLQVGRIPKEISEAAETAFLGNAKGELVATEYEVPQEIETEFDAVAYARGQIMGS